MGWTVYKCFWHKPNKQDVTLHNFKNPGLKATAGVTDLLQNELRRAFWGRSGKSYGFIKLHLITYEIICLACCISGKQNASDLKKKKNLLMPRIYKVKDTQHQIWVLKNGTRMPVMPITWRKLINVDGLRLLFLKYGYYLLDNVII